MGVVPYQSHGLLSSLSDEELLNRLSALLKASRRVESVLIAHIGEVDARRLYAREATQSMFAYCVERLHLSEPEAYLRIAVGRAARDHPLILAMLADGRLHLSGVAKLIPHLTRENAPMLLERAAGCSKRRIEEMVAELIPRPPAADQVRRLPETPARLPATHEGPLAPTRHVRSAPLSVPAVRPDRSEPLAPDRYRIQFTADAPFCDKLERLKDLMRLSVPDGGLFALLDRAVSDLVARLEAKRFGLTSRPRERGEARVEDPSRYVPLDVRRTVFARDGGRCRFVGPGGHRCPARRQLEYHHVEPHARGGKAVLANIQLMCRTHNVCLAERDFGAAHMERFRQGPEPSRPPPGAPSRA